MHAQSPSRLAFARQLARALTILLPLVAASTAAIAAPKSASIVIDALTGEDLYAEDADAHRYPASLTKVMTLYVVFEELSAGRLTLDTDLVMSAYASARPPTKIGIAPGGTITVRDAIKALVTKSANDVATAFGENIAGSESAFAARMTKTARRLGMSKTTFRNASGLPDGAQKTTARDMARLGLAIQRDFPQYYGIFETRVFEYNRRRYGNHNRLLGRVRGVDGIKTGYTNASGFNLLTSVRRDGRQLVAVVMGGRTGAARNARMTKLVETYLPKASRGEPLVYAAWSDAGPPPIPGRRPTLAVRFASRLTSGDAPEDPITQTVMAFAAETRAAVGTDDLVATPRIASDALQAVIAQADTTAAVAGAPLPATPSAAAPMAFAALPAATKASPAPPSGSRTARGVEVAALPPADPNADATPAPRFADAFGVFSDGDSANEDRLAEAIDRAMVPTGGVTVIAMGSAPRTLGERAPIAAFIEKSAGRYERSDRQPAAANANNAVDKPARKSERAVVAPTEATPQLAPPVVDERAALDAPWQIQLGAVPTKAAADRILAAAHAAEPAMAQHIRVTVPVATANGTLYRARLAGFRTRAEAQSACKRFANHNHPCWAVSM